MTEESPEPRPWYTEVDRQLAERAALAQDAAHTVQRKAQARAKVSELDTGAEERRRWALQQAQETGVADRIGGKPRLVAFVNPDGSTNVRSDPEQPGKTIATTVHTDRPLIVGECRIWTDEEEAEWEHRRREAENALLAAHYDIGEMVAAGILSAAEAESAGVQAVAAARAKRVAARDAPYDLERSVR